MRLLYVSDIRPGSITQRRVSTFRRLGWEVEEFDLGPYLARLRNPFSRRLAVKRNLGGIVRQINRDLSMRAIRGRYDVAFVAKGILIDPGTVADLRRNASLGVCIHYSADPTLVTYRTRFFEASVEQYSLCVTTKVFDLPLYRALKPRDVLLVPQGFDRDFAFWSPERRVAFDTDIVFVGRAEPHYVRTLLSLSEVTPNIAIYGPWGKAVRRHPGLAAFWGGSSVYGRDYADRLRSARIGLGLLTRIHPDQSTTRTFEIPSVGAFLLAERTQEHTSLFEEGMEAAFYSSSGELQALAGRFLADSDEREGIAEAGHQRCLGNYSTEDIMATVFDRALGLLSSEHW